MRAHALAVVRSHADDPQLQAALKYIEIADLFYRK
jgi:hypothetical protein